MNIIKIFSICFATILLASCEKEITLDIGQADAKLVVEGYIENDFPPFISLTSTIPFYGEINLNELDNYYVHDAIVKVSDGISEVILTEYCLNELPEELIPLVAEFLGLELDSLGSFPVDVCLYTDPNIFTGLPTIIGEAGKSYSLAISYDGETYSAITKIPELNNLDSVFVKNIPSPDTDSLYRLYCTITDPDTLGNYYRYFTSQNGGAFYTGFASVTDDLIFNGATFDFTLDRGISPTEEFDPNTYGYFFAGDTIILKWIAIDQPTYHFFNSLEFDSGTDGPFSSVTIVQGNISNEALGAWYGYGTTYDTVIVAE